MIVFTKCTSLVVVVVAGSTGGACVCARLESKVHACLVEALSEVLADGDSAECTGGVSSLLHCCPLITTDDYKRDITVTWHPQSCPGLLATATLWSPLSAPTTVEHFRPRWTLPTSNVSLVLLSSGTFFLPIDSIYLFL